MAAFGRVASGVVKGIRSSKVETGGCGISGNTVSVWTRAGGVVDSVDMISMDEVESTAEATVAAGVELGVLAGLSLAKGIAAGVGSVAG